MLLNRAEKFDESFLFSGDDLYLSDKVIVKHPKIQDILSISKSTKNSEIYWGMVNVLLCDPYTNMVMLDDLNINYLEVTPYEVFLLQWANCIEEYHKNKNQYDQYGFHPLYYTFCALNFFLGEKEYSIENINLEQEPVLVDIKSKTENSYDWYINKEMFNTLSNFIFAINNLSDDDKINPKDEMTRQMLIDDMRQEQRRKSRKRNVEQNKDYIGILSKALVFGGNGGVNIFNYKQIKVYQLFSGMSITDKKILSNQLISGLYSGNVKKESIKQSELNWKE